MKKTEVTVGAVDQFVERFLSSKAESFARSVGGTMGDLLSPTKLEEELTNVQHELEMWSLTKKKC